MNIFRLFQQKKFRRDLRIETKSIERFSAEGPIGGIYYFSINFWVQRLDLLCELVQKTVFGAKI